MEKFKSLSKEPVDVVEGKIIDRWLKDDLLQKCIDERKNRCYGHRKLNSNDSKIATIIAKIYESQDAIFRNRRSTSI